MHYVPVMGIHLDELKSILPHPAIDALITIEEAAGVDADCYLEDEDFLREISAEKFQTYRKRLEEAGAVFKKIAADSCDWAGRKLKDSARKFSESMNVEKPLPVADLRELVVLFLADLTQSKKDWIEAMLYSSAHPSSTDLQNASALPEPDWQDPIFSGMQDIAENSGKLAYEKDKLKVSFHPLDAAQVTVVMATTLTDRIDMDDFFLTRRAFSFLKASRIGEEHLENCETVPQTGNIAAGDIDAFCMSQPIDLVVEKIDPRYAVMRIHEIRSNDGKSATYLCKLMPEEYYPDYKKSAGAKSAQPMGEVYVYWHAEKVSEKSSDLKLTMGLFFKADPLLPIEQRKSAQKNNELVEFFIRQFYSDIIMPKMYDTYLDGVERFAQARQRLSKLK